MRRCLLALVSVAACGGTPSQDAAPKAPIASIVAPRATEADIIVAQVNGRPVWGSCVSEQVTRGAADRKAALEQCIDFELLAQAAEKRGLATDKMVTDATRTAMVSELVATDFEARYAKPADLGPALDAAVAKNAWRMHRPDLRASRYVRAVAPLDAPPELDAKAKQLAEAIAAELAPETGLLPNHVVAVAERLAVGTGFKIESQDVPLTSRNGPYEPRYLDALFSIPEIGRVSKPSRTSRGWDVVLFSDGLAPLETTREQIAEGAFPEVRRAQFTLWVNELAKASGVTIEIDQATVAKLDEVAK